MSDLEIAVLIPLGITILGLIIEYWIIQPLRKINESSASHSSRYVKNAQPSLKSYISRLLVASSRISLNRVGAGFVETVGVFLAVFPSILLTPVMSVVVIIAAVPMFVALYYSEKLGGCRFQPSCKEYFVGALEVHGPLKGIWLGLRRTMHCNPLSAGGYDPVPEKGKTSLQPNFPTLPYNRREKLAILLLMSIGILLAILNSTSAFILIFHFGISALLRQLKHNPIMLSFAFVALCILVYFFLIWIFGYLMQRLLRRSGAAWVVVSIALVASWYFAFRVMVYR